MSHKKKSVFTEGPISPEFIAKSIAAHQGKPGIGAHSLFLGQVRADQKDGATVAYIDYTAYEQMAEQVMHLIREECFTKFPITCMHIYHSLGRVPTGGISLFVFTSAPHRQGAIDACSYIVERIKREVPVWGKEWLTDDTSVWKSSNNAHI